MDSGSTNPAVDEFRQTTFNVAAGKADRTSSDLIFDIGFHEGHDARFYMAKGFRVVGVEANPALCRRAEQQFAEPISEGSLIIVNKALDYAPGKVTLYVSDRSDLSSLDPSFPSRFGAQGPGEPIEVEAITTAQLMATYGTPYFMKVDIEGRDLAVVDGLKATDARPPLVSLENDRDSFSAVHREIKALVELGYDRFKVVNQRSVVRQHPPMPAREGRYVDYAFGLASSGLFGDEAPGEWLSAEKALAVHRRNFWHYALLGDYRVAPRWAQSLAWRLGVRVHWWDTHAKHSSC